MKFQHNDCICIGEDVTAAQRRGAQTDCALPSKPGLARDVGRLRQGESTREVRRKGSGLREVVAASCGDAQHGVSCPRDLPVGGCVGRASQRWVKLLGRSVPGLGVQVAREGAAV